METNQDKTVFVWLGANVLGSAESLPLIRWQLATSPIGVMFSNI